MEDGLVFGDGGDGCGDVGGEVGDVGDGHLDTSLFGCVFRPCWVIIRSAASAPDTTGGQSSRDRQSPRGSACYRRAFCAAWCRPGIPCLRGPVRHWQGKFLMARLVRAFAAGRMPCAPVRRQAVEGLVVAVGFFPPRCRNPLWTHRKHIATLIFTLV